MWQESIIRQDLHLAYSSSIKSGMMAVHDPPPFAFLRGQSAVLMLSQSLSLMSGPISATRDIVLPGPPAPDAVDVQDSELADQISEDALPMTAHRSLLEAATHTHTVHRCVTILPSRRTPDDGRAIWSDTAGSVDPCGTDGGICILRLKGHCRCDGSDYAAAE